MIRYEDPNQPCLPGFEKFFGIALDKQNRWIKLSEVIPWDEFAKAYCQNMSSKRGRPAKAARLVIGAVIIKHKLCLSDEETIDQIRENPYLQYFVGLTTFQTKSPFVPSLFVEIRRRMGDDVFEQFNQSIINKLESENRSKTNQKHDDDKTGGSQQNSDNPETEKTVEEEQRKSHGGKLIIDATVAEQAIRFPTDLGLLNEAREVSEDLIDTLYPLSGLTKKPRTYRQKARKAYLALVKQRNPKKNKRRKGIKQQLQFLKRNLGHIDNLLDLVVDESTALSDRQRRQYWIIQHLYGQQEEMHRNSVQRCDHRIVSISQPQVRPIVRGKSGKKVEFGSKLGVSLTGNKLAHVDHLSWEAYNEGHDLPDQVEAYKKRYGHYPEVVIADPLYGSRANRKYLNQYDIRFAGKALGRPKKVTEENQQKLKGEVQRRKAEYRARIPVEGKFGQGKNGYRLNYIRARTQATSEAWIRSIFLVMNLLVLSNSFLAPVKVAVSYSYSVVKELFYTFNRLVKVLVSPAKILPQIVVSEMAVF
ncbi:MAG: IS5 family transposase [Anaerolineaceae bacterium]|nr:IS5 family transposase [Anaerolineaceae bacterium]